MRSAAKAASVSGMALVLLALVVPTASAQQASCRTTQVCMFKDVGFVGGIAAYAGNDAGYRNNFFDQCPRFSWNCELNDLTSSIDNDGQSCQSRHYVDSYARGLRWDIPRGGDEPNMHYYAGAGDNLSSRYWC